MFICKASAPDSTILPCGVHFRRELGGHCINPEKNECDYRADEAWLIEVQKKKESVLDQPYNIRIKYALTYHTSTTGEPITFKNRHYLIKLYQDHAPEQVHKKATQTGSSEYGVIRMLVNAIEEKKSTLIIFPTDIPDRNDFVDSRVSPPIDRSPYYSSHMKQFEVRAKDKKSLKRIGDVFCYFYGSNKKFKSYSVHDIIFEEYDELNQDYLATARSRQSWIDPTRRSEFKLGNPTYHNQGIALEYERSNQQVYMIRCGACGTLQELNFFKHICRQEDSEGFNYTLLDREWYRDPSVQAERDIHVYCEKCARPMERIIDGMTAFTNDGKERAKWVALNPRSSISGYHISKLYSPVTRMAELWRTLQKARFNQSEMKKLYNDDLGLEFTPAGNSIPRTVLDELTQINPYLMPSVATGTVIAGIDVQPPKLKVILAEMITGDAPLRAVYIGSMDWEELKTVLVEKYHCRLGVMDVQPEINKAKEWQAKLKELECRMWLCIYATHPMRDEAWERDEELWRIKADRNQTLDKTQGWLHQKELLLPANLNDLPLDAERESDRFYSHVTKPKRVFKEDKTGQTNGYYEWIHKPDDWLMCLNYLRMAWEILRPQTGIVKGTTVSYPDKQAEEHRILRPQYTGLLFGH